MKGSTVLILAGGAFVFCQMATGGFGPGPQQQLGNLLAAVGVGQGAAGTTGQQVCRPPCWPTVGRVGTTSPI